MPHAWRRDGYLVSTDAALIDVDLVHRFLSEESYWSRGVPLDVVRCSLEHSIVFGLHEERDGGRAQAGFARVITDRATMAYLADVFVLQPHRGLGLGVWLIDCVRAHPALQGLRVWLLATQDAHGLYEKHGFRALEHPERVMAIVDPDIYTRGR
jgi:GNAT superfamily N-acetyltransferase